MYSQSRSSKAIKFLYLGKLEILLCVAAVTVFVIAWWRYNDMTEYFDIFNSIREELYPSFFTFLSILWGASLTIWALLKSRATRYVERLHDNVVFLTFLKQFEARLVLGFAVIVSSFVVYVADLHFDAIFSWGEFTLLIWMCLFFGVIGLILDSLLSARVVLG